MKAVISFCPRALSLRLPGACLIVAALGLQIGFNEANAVSAPSPESKVDFGSDPNPVLEPHDAMLVSYRPFAIKAPRSLSQMRSEIGKETMAAVLKLNRVDARHVRAGDTLLVPEPMTDLITLSPFPSEIETARDIPKLLFVSRRVQAFGAYEFGRIVRWGPTSTGKKATPTPAGLYHTNWRSKSTHSTVNPAWLLRWYFNIDNARGISIHEYDLPGYPASHACIRLLADDAAWIYAWADEWILSPDNRRIVAHGTPVIVFGEYAYTEKPPWKLLVTDLCATTVTSGELEETIRKHFPYILRFGHFESGFLK